MSAPNPVPPQPYRPRSFFGPVLLVVLGVVFLLCTTGVIAWRYAGWWFVRYWPVVLILWGVVKLVEYLWARQRGYATPRLGAGAIVFVVFLIIFGSTVSGIAGWSEWPNVRAEIEKESDFNFDFFNSKHEFSE